MGELLRRGGWRRESLVISTKLFWGEPSTGRASPNDRGSPSPHEPCLPALALTSTSHVPHTGLSRKHIVEG
jgi:aryl-alcohol dehydrogenase-like predicted oxidoreductase